MKAQSLRAAIACLFAATLAAFNPTQAADYPTTNFVVYAPTTALAQEIGEAAETFRRDLAMEWLGRRLPDWPERCPLVAQVNPRIGAQGATTYFAGNGRAWGYKMEVYGSRERILDSVLPHEVTHTIFATHFGRRLPRWADEGACTTVEDVSERRKHDKLLVHFLRNDRGIALHQLFSIQEYPEDILPLYSQGYSLCRFLIEQKGRKAFVNFMADGMERGDWLGAVERQYGYSSFVELQATWMAWIKEGSPVLAGRPYRLDGGRLDGGRLDGGRLDGGRLDDDKTQLAGRDDADRGVSTASNQSRELVSVAGSKVDVDGWYSRRYDELKHRPREYATSHSTGKPGAPAVRDASTLTIRR